jgi:hypothetical protein
VEHDFEYIGPRSMLLNANTLSSMPDAEPMILLAIEDITEEDGERQEVGGRRGLGGVIWFDDRTTLL